MNKIKTMFLLSIMSISLFSCSSYNESLSVIESESTAMKINEYDIYPNPQEIIYYNSYSKIKNIKINYNGYIDEYNKQKLIDILYEHKIMINEINYDFVIDVICPENEENYDDFLFNKFDAYQLNILNNKASFISPTQEGIFYSLLSFESILNKSTSSEDSFIDVKINDYSDSMYRGFIEGYYGIPWSKDERIELINYASKMKGNIYIYAPKDDSYHSSNWKGLYTDKDLSLLKEVIEVGNKNKVRFAWSIHPFIHDPFKEETYESDIDYIKNKFNQLYDAGVRQFVVSADDVDTTVEGSGDGKLHARMLNELSSFLKQKEDCYNLIFVPSAYCYESEASLRVNLINYYSDLVADLDESVSIMWTGERVCSSITTGRFEEFKQLSNGRLPFFWLNWPVNDYSPSHLLLGKAEVLNDNYLNKEINFSGIVTNPMQECEPSKLAIYAICDYCWNLSSFDMDDSYQRSFKTIEEKEYSSLMDICSYLTNAGEYEGKYFEESPLLKQYIDDFKNEMNQENYDLLLNKINESLSNCSSYLLKAKNIKLKETLKPWIDALIASLEASKQYLYLLFNQNSIEINEYNDLTLKANEYYELSKSYKSKKLDLITQNIILSKVEVASSVLTPFMEYLHQMVNLENDINMGNGIGVIYYGFNGIYDGDVSNIIDNDLSTYCWFNDVPKEDAYILYDLGEVIELKDIKITFGNERGLGDHLVGEILISTDGRNFEKISDINCDEFLLDLRTSTRLARYIKLANKGTETWVSIKEIEINTLPKLNGIVTLTGINLEPSVTTSLDNMIDNDLSTFTWFEINKNEHAEIVVDFLNLQKINTISLFMGKESSPYDYFYDYSLLVSIDNVNYTLVGEEHYLDKKELILDLTDSNINARYIKLVSNSSSPFGVVIREFNINL